MLQFTVSISQIVIMTRASVVQQRVADLAISAMAALEQYKTIVLSLVVMSVLAKMVIAPKAGRHLIRQ